MKKILPISLFLAFCLLFSVACTPKEEEGSAEIGYDMHIELEENTLSGTEKVSFVNVYADGLTEAVFHLYPNCYASDAVDKAYNGVLPAYGGIEIQSVTGENVEGFSCSDNQEYLTVTFPERQKGETVCVEITFAVTIPSSTLRLGEKDGNILLTCFYPQLSVYRDGFLTDAFTTIGDPMVSEAASYAIEFSCPSEYVVASSLVPSTQVQEEGVTRYSYQGENIRDYAFVLSKDFTVRSDTVGHTELYYFSLNDTDAEERFSLQKAAFAAYTEAFGECGLSSYSVVCLPFEYSGMEYSGLAVVSSGLGEDTSDAILHETAHQWWYHLVGNDGVRQSVLDEGLTSFSAVCFYALQGESAVFSEKMTNVKTAYTQYETLQKRRRTGTKLNLDGTLYDYTSYQYTMLMYYKGCMLFNNLYELYGMEKMKTCLQSYAKTYAHKIADVDDFIAVCNTVLKTDVQGLVYGWLNGNGTVTTFKTEK